MKEVKRVRLLKVIVQPILVVDDGENLQEVKQQPIEVPASAWPDFAGSLEEQLGRVQEQVNSEPQ